MSRLQSLQSNSTGADDQQVLDPAQVSAVQGMDGDRRWLNQRTLLVAHFLWKRDDLLGRDGDHVGHCASGLATQHL